MPRQGGGRSAPARRPAPPPARPAAPQQTRSSSTAAAPRPMQQQAPPPAAQQSAGPGLFGQMASTAAGVAVGSSIGHAVGGWFSGGSSAAPQEVQQMAASPAQAQQFDQMAQNGECATELRMFKECAAAYGGDQPACKFPMDTLMNCFKGTGSNNSSSTW